MTTTLIKNGTFFDGSGAKGKKADILLKDGKVEAVFDQAPIIEDAKEIDASGKWVTPGFIDIHTHYDAEIEVMPGLEESNPTWNHHRSHGQLFYICGFGKG